uniref:Elongation of very long chain fatty acids protein n=1 Tax=Echeneis naucrates TaxID=173247 RepID=A0A665WTF3_ECHNA
MNHSWKPITLASTLGSHSSGGLLVIIHYQEIHKRTDGWLLVRSPAPISCIFLCYLAIIWAGPKLMAKRQPVNLKAVLIGYNFAMVCLSAYMFYEFTASSWLSRYSLLCQPVDYSGSPLAMRMARVCWWFYFSKVIELSDTVSAKGVNDIIQHNP